MNFLKITFLSLILLFFFSCKENDSQALNQKTSADDFVIQEAFGLLNINNEELQKTPAAYDFINYRLSKTDEFKILDELGIHFSQFKESQICFSQEELFILQFNKEIDLSKIYEQFINKASGKYSGELLSFESYKVYRVSRKDESRFLCQVLPNTIIMGSQNDILTSLSSEANAQNSLIKHINKTSPLSLVAQQSPYMPSQLKNLTSLKGDTSNKEKIHIKLEASFEDEKSCKTTENMVKTLLGFAPLPSEMKKSLKFTSETIKLEVTAELSDEDLKAYLDSKEEKKAIAAGPGAPLQKEKE